MILINEYRLSPDKKHLIVDVQIQELSYYDNVTLVSIVINNQIAYNPSLGAEGISTESTKQGAWIYSITACEGQKHYREFIDLESAGLPYTKIDSTIFFMNVTSTENWEANTPCEMKDSSILAVTYNKYPIYQKSMKMLNTLQGCEPSREFIDYILQLKAFELCLEVGNYSKAIEYWDIFFTSTESTNSSSNRCGCHG